MRSFTLLLLMAPSFLMSQDCPSPSPISLEGFGSQTVDNDFFDDSDFLDDLNPPNNQPWSLGTGISDNNLTSWSNAGVTTFLTVKLRNALAPNDNVPNAGNAYLVEPGYSPDEQSGPAGTGGTDGLSNWNVIMYTGLDEASGANFSNVQVIYHIDFDPAECYDLSEMASLNVGEEFNNNTLSNSADQISSFGINSNLGFDYFEALNTGADFNALTAGYYTFAIEVLDLCGNQKLWNEITVHVGTIGSEDPKVILDGVVELSGPVDDWSGQDYITSLSGNIELSAIEWIDYPGRLEDGRYSVSRIYTVVNACGNASDVGQLLIADDSNASGCTNAFATNYDVAAVNDDGFCDYSPACLGDLNLDNIIGTTDLLILLSSFGLPCPS